ncbi:hypothetical protein F4604DRAFT_1697717, partial [Suillus subluteus]
TGLARALASSCFSGFRVLWRRFLPGVFAHCKQSKICISLREMDGRTRRGEYSVEPKFNNKRPNTLDHKPQGSANHESCSS